MKKIIFFFCLLLGVVNLQAQKISNSKKASALARLERVQNGYDPSSLCTGVMVQTCFGPNKFPAGSDLFDECCTLMWINGRTPNSVLKRGDVILLLSGEWITLTKQQAQNGFCCITQDQWHAAGKASRPCPPNAGLCDVRPLMTQPKPLDIPKPEIEPIKLAPCICDTIRDTITIVKDTIIRDTVTLPCNECDSIHMKFLEHKGFFIYGNMSLSALRREGKQELIDFGKPMFGLGGGYVYPFKKRLAPCMAQSLRLQVGLMTTHRQYVPDPCGCNNVPAVSNIGYEAELLYRVHLIRNWPWDFNLGIGPTTSYTPVTSDDADTKSKIDPFAWNIIIQPEIARHFNKLEVAVAVTLPVLRNSERNFGASLTLRYLIKGKKKAEVPKTIVQPTDTLQIDTIKTDTLDMGVPQNDTLEIEAPQTDTIKTETPPTDTLKTETPQSEVPQTELPEREVPPIEAPQTEEERIEGEKAEGIKPEGQ